MSVRLVSVNVERSKHLHRVIPFLQGENPDVTCIQELCEKDIPAFAGIVGDDHLFVPMMRYTTDDRPVTGLGIFSRTPFLANDVSYYRGSPDKVPDFDDSSVDMKAITENAMLVTGDFEKDGMAYRIGTTHFTWTPNGLPNDYQRKDLKGLMAGLEKAGELVFCGDFNAPRGLEIFAKIEEKYKDNIPPEYEWSLDLNLHKAADGRLQNNAKIAGLPGFMVDGLFSTPSYQCSDVRLVEGVSDHRAIVATVEKK